MIPWQNLVPVKTFFFFSVCFVTKANLRRQQFTIKVLAMKVNSFVKKVILCLSAEIVCDKVSKKQKILINNFLCSLIKLRS